MKRKPNSSSRRNQRKRKQPSIYETLEARQLLAGVYEPTAIADPFGADAVTVKQMIDRASVKEFVTDELVVAIRLGGSADSARTNLQNIDWAALTGDANATQLKKLMSVDRDDGATVSLVQLKFGEKSDIFAAMHELDRDPRVMWSSPNFIESGNVKELIPNDFRYLEQYHHPLMQNDDAWDITLGSPDIIIGVTDDGVELGHSDLTNNIWQNTGEIPGDSIDNDGNGYVDDVNGWDFSSGDNDPNPNSPGDSHGTHVAGIAAAETDNFAGIAGTAGESTIMPLQFFGVGAWTAAVINETFTYAVDNGVNILNTSYNIDGWWGDPVFTAGLQYMYDNNVLHFNSAGNGDSLNTARQQFDQTILVASTEADDSRSSFTNYGYGVDVSAPGGAILSSVTGNDYDFFSGTSMAAPNAAGVAALIWAENPTWTHSKSQHNCLGRRMASNSSIRVLKDCSDLGGSIHSAA